MRKISVLLLAVLCLLSLGGCWDKQEIEDNTYAVLLGIDAAEDKTLIVTVAFPLTQTEGGASEGESKNGGGEYSVMSVKAATVVEGLNLFTTKLAGPLALYTVKTIVISQEIAQGDMLRQVFASWRNEQIRNTANVLVSECKAAEFIEARIKNPLIDPLRQEELLLEQANGSANYKPIQLLDFLANLNSDRRDSVAMYVTIAAKEGQGGEGQGGEGQGGEGQSGEGQSGEGQEEKKTAEIKEELREGYLPAELPISAQHESQISGAAVFRGARMVGTLNSLETQTYAMLLSSGTKKLVTVEDPLSPGDQIVVGVLPGGKTEIDSAIGQEGPAFTIDVALRCTVEYLQSEVDYARPEHVAVLTEQIRSTCVKNMTDLIEKVQTEYRADIFSLGDQLARHFATEQAWEGYDWPARYREAEISLNVSVTVERTGIMLG